MSGEGMLCVTLGIMTSILVGYARVSTAGQDLSLQRDSLQDLGVLEDRVYLDHGLTGTNRDRPGLDQALAALRAGDTLVVTKLDRLARSVPDAHAIAREIEGAGARLSIGGSVYDPADPMGKLLFSTLAMIAEFEADLIRLRTREGMAAARAKGRLRGKQPKLSAAQEKHLVTLYKEDAHTVGEIAALFAVTRPTVYRALDRAGVSRARRP